MLKKRYAKLDIFNFLRLPPEEMAIEYEEFLEQFIRVRNRIFELRDQGALQTAIHLEGPPETVVAHGLNNVGLYHAKRPLLRAKTGEIISQDLYTLYYYHNRMDGYELE